MKKINFILFLAVLTAISCRQEQKKESKTPQKQAKTTEKPDKNSKTYAELAIRKGDDWKPEKFGGGEFMNVDSLQLPEGHKDHAYYIRYEGPGWENAQVGYRMYLDWRNAIDIYGKKVDTLVLPYVGQDDYEAYHHESPWGQDILKAGKSLGIGGFGRFMNDTVAHFRNVKKTVAYVENDANVSKVKINYDGWKTGDKSIDLDAQLEIFPSGRFTKATLIPSAALEGLCTGIVKFDDVPAIQKKSKDGSWGYIATYGTQTLVNDTDKLGMVIFYKTAQVGNILKGNDDHLVVFKPSNETITYYFSGAWEQEHDGIKTEEDFIASIDENLATLATNGKLE
ncbi:DUF4861 family protein [Flavimarina sp. Hel_I_48]|uniref:DUF4861 family protein n=1 Tax=Flavimarina sp. Hel_I_48 TaxID=1392488 RepID=UPI0004DEDF60|nr:DUF4861 family protein [Flavimarina sp. Hel_I_48]